jgi:uncharacterized protein (TIGR02594 family)
MLNLVKVSILAVLAAIILTALPVQSQAKQIAHHAKHRVLKHKQHHIKSHKHYFIKQHHSSKQSTVPMQSYWQDERARQEAAGQPVSTDLIAIASRFLGRGNPTGFRGPWCGAFMALVARMGGYAVPSGYLQARQWIHAGQRLSKPEYGAVAVWTGHVGLVRQWPVIISGNFGHRVAVGVQRRQKLLGFVRLNKLRASNLFEELIWRLHPIMDG